MAAPAPSARAWPRKALNVLRQEFENFNLRLCIARALAWPFPDEVGRRIRTNLLRLAGLDIGRGAVFSGMPKFQGGGGIGRLLHIGAGSWFNVGCRLDVHAEVRIGSQVRFGQEVLLLTHTHELGPSTRRAGDIKAEPVTIGDGAWIGARATILPGVTIGAGAVVAAGSVVTRDVPANVLAGGVPARVIRELTPGAAWPAEETASALSDTGA